VTAIVCKSYRALGHDTNTVADYQCVWEQNTAVVLTS